MKLPYSKAALYTRQMPVASRGLRKQVQLAGFSMYNYAVIEWHD